MTDPLDEILAACGIPDESKYRMMVQRDGHNVVTERYDTLTIGGVTLPISGFQMHHSVEPDRDELGRPRRDPMKYARNDFKIFYEEFTGLLDPTPE